MHAYIYILIIYIYMHADIGMRHQWLLSQLVPLVHCPPSFETNNGKEGQDTGFASIVFSAQ